MKKNLRSAAAVGIAFMLTVAVAAPGGTTSLEKSAKATTSLSIAK
ncbi:MULTISPECIES: hypothetical protein [Deinococcus]|uniref:Uncharacterized protein n=1 Tax=Deinococcus rufus TaxID=2136097 RepID=A0ABV7Z797_9DEIO|nr:hypothetical protein [Deinococcus sp. AB2017081]WQE94594.1 hypothetical protein U2P90_14440 [Deinococcus sp. AB2017081]